MGHVLCRFVYSPCLIILSLGNMCGSNSYMQKCFLVPFYVHLVLFLILVLVTFVHSLLSIYILMFTVSISFIFNVAACMFIFFFLSVSSSCYPYGTVFCCFLFCRIAHTRTSYQEAGQKRKSVQQAASQKRKSTWQAVVASKRNTSKKSKSSQPPPPLKLTLTTLMKSCSHHIHFSHHSQFNHHSKLPWHLPRWRNSCIKVSKHAFRSCSLGSFIMNKK